MKNNSKVSNSVEKRTTPRNYLDIFYSVEITVSANDQTSLCYQFKLRNISDSGMCVLVSEESKILNHLQTGSVIDIKYCPVNPDHPHKKMRTQIKHITYVPGKKTAGKGHYYVGLLIKDDKKTYKPSYNGHEADLDLTRLTSQHSMKNPP